MKNRLSADIKILLLTVMVPFIITGCNATKNLGKNESLLARNSIVIKSEYEVKNKWEIKDNLYRLETQKPNSKFLRLPTKLYQYNFRYKKFHNRPDSSLPKRMERPVIFDTSLIAKSDQNMRNYLFNLGFYYVKIKDTFYSKHKRTYLTHEINLGGNYKINNVTFDVEDSSISKILEDTKSESVLQKDRDYSIALIDEERSRIVSVIRNKGYFHFTLENILTFSLDTFDKSFFKSAESPIEGIIEYVANEKKINKSFKEDVEIKIRPGEDPSAFDIFTVASVNVYPDYKNNNDLTDTTLIKRRIDSIQFYYHNNYVNSDILFDHIFIKPGHLYSQEDFDKTFAKLNELGIFQYIRIVFTENPITKNTLDCNIYMYPLKKYDFSQNDELSSGTTYDLGISGGLNFHNKNFLKGANLLTISLNGGIEYAYNDTIGRNLINHFYILTEYLGLNASIDFPKFISPIGRDAFDNYNIPHTIISGGSNIINRLDYFQMINTSFNYTYSWHKTRTVTWTFSPVFFNIIRMPYETDSFIAHLEKFPFLANSYKPNFIEGENLSFTYNDIEKKHNKNYSFLHLGIEESGGILSSLNQLGVALNDLYKIYVAQYAKFDFDARHFFTLNHSVLAFRFSGGVGIPYGHSNTLPYIKQFFVGGPYSLRGWQVRTLGPGTYYDSANIRNSTIDRTADIKLEFAGEYRFPITPLFAGAIKMNGAIFADAGNIWLAKKDASFPGGEFEFNTLGQCLAADMGTGLRFDIASFLTFRTDIAMPVKRPNISTDGGWVFSEVNFANPTWRTNNLVLQFAIGYPF